MLINNLEMQSLFHTNFFNDKGTLRVNQNGPVLVFFKMNNCPACNSFFPVFSQFAGMNAGVTAYATCDASRELVDISRETKLPIMAVPLVLFFYDTYPRAKFTGDRTLPALQDFLRNIQSQIIQGNRAQPPLPPQRGQTQIQAPGPGPSSMYAAGARRPAPPPPQPPPRRGGNPYALLGSGVEEEDDDKLLVPKSVIPKSAPWIAAYRDTAGGEDM